MFTTKTRLALIWLAATTGFPGDHASAAEPLRAGPDWWSLQPIRKPESPKVHRQEWVRNPIDAFVLARLEAKGLEPAPAVDPRVLIRRVTFDLIGLPPTPNEVDMFVKEWNAKPQAAFESLIDRLLASPHYGERWARHWLDTVRFAESNGFEYDRLRENAWHYRDYVIRALNDDKPYAQFVKEQLAGDVMTPATRDGTIATGFLVAGPWDQAGHGAVSTTVRGKVREDEMEEMLAAVGQTFLGLTINCSRCHDHKFDPLTAKDYFRMKAIFTGVWHGERTLAAPGTVQKALDEIARQQVRIDDVARQIAEIEKRGRAKLAVLGKKEANGLPQPKARWTFEGDARDLLGGLHGTLKGGAKIDNGRLVLDGKAAFVETVPLTTDLRVKTLETWVALSNREQRGGAAITIEDSTGVVFDAIVFGEKQPGRWMAGSNGFIRTRDRTGAAVETAKPGELVHVAIVYSADNRIAIYRNGEPDGESYIPGNERIINYRANDSRLLFGRRHTGGGNAFLAGAIEEARLYDRPLTAEEVRASFKAGVERIALRDILMALKDEERRDHQRLEADLARLRSALPSLPATSVVYAASIRPIGVTHLLKRGDPELKGEEVNAGPPTAIKGPESFDLPTGIEDGKRRVQFADWVSHRDNPLTWRVMVNRVWQHHFADGIVRSPSDFGYNGERPTHPELLDWLAYTFREQGGSLKQLHRLILLSATYQQSSKYSPKAAEIDADNRLLWRFAPRRLEAEAVRDAMLAISGQLNRQAGGPSFRPFKISEFNAAFYQLTDEDRPDFNRRSIYRINVNSGKDTLLDTLDCPDPSVKTPRRATTTTPLQALTMMNNSFVQRQARLLAERVVKEAGNDVDTQVASVYRFTLGRDPSKLESERAAVVVKEHGLKAVCWAILNASEFVYIR